MKNGENTTKCKYNSLYWGDRMNIGVIYLITAVICMFFNILILERTIATKYKETIDKSFCGMLIFFAVFNLVDMCWGIFFSKEYIISQAGFIIVGYMYHSFAAVSAYVWLGYTIHYMGLRQKNTLDLIRKILLVIQVVLLATNSFTRAAFDVDALGNYSMGSLRKFLYAMQFFYYIVLGLYGILKYFTDNGEKKSLYKNAIVFSFVPFIFGIGQYLFYDMAMYSLGFAFSALIIYSYNVTAQREKFMEDSFGSVSRKQASIIHGLAGNFMSIYYVDMENDSFDIYRKDNVNGILVKEEKKGENYFASVLEEGSKVVVDEDREKLIYIADKQEIEKALSGKNTFSVTMRVMYNAMPHYFEYKFVKPFENRENKKLIVGVYDIDEEIRYKISQQKNTEKLTEDAYMDALTGLYNRRAYEESIKDYLGIIDTDDFVYVSMDVNGLKNVNDNLGHEAGDELISGAASCMKKAFENYGHTYRTGGDEFVAILFLDEMHLKMVLDEFENIYKRWTGERITELSISYGCVTHAEFPVMGVLELSKLADQRMYKHKAQYYASKGIDRRGNSAAFEAIRKLYTKILKVNLTENKFTAVQVSEADKRIENSYSEVFSEWINNFAETGQVYENDKENYLSQMKLENLKNHFMAGNKYFSIKYKRKSDLEYKDAILEIVPANDYADEEQNVYLYVKEY